MPIEHGAAGYTLEVPPESIDVTRFEALVREGHALLERHRFRRAAEVLRAALALWRGRPFDGILEDGVIRAEAVRLEELRLHALESRIEADLETGRADELVDELEVSVAEHPFRERFWRQLMLALYRAGRQADALAAYHRAREALDEQLGLEPGEELRALEASILRQDVPAPIATRRAPDLPVPLTSFVGRLRELDDVRELLARSRLVTLVGVGGVGKTRLALEAARGASDVVADAVAFIDLAALSDPSSLEGHVAATLGVREASGQELTEAIAEHLRAADYLVVLDNCEHVREAAARLAWTLLEACPDLRILATSREVLDVAGEAAYPVPPLSLPDPDGDPESLRASEAVRLLVDRATLTRHDMRVDDSAYATAARICRELDGLPLAIELAAARTKALSLDEIAVRLRDRFQFLVAWRRLSAARHRTLREAMDWSFELLDPDEQTLLVRLSVFPAGATLASIATVCLEGDAASAERLLERLVDTSLVVPVSGERGTRYRLLETVRQYGAERLAPEDAADLRRRHAERIRVVAESTNLALEGHPGSMSFELAREELPSIRAAIQWTLTADPSVGLQIACALERFWVTNQAREGIATFSALLERDGVPDELRARGYRGRGGCRYYMAEFEAGVADYEAALAIHRQLGQRGYEAHLATRLAVDAERVGDHALAQVLLDEAASVDDAERFLTDRWVELGVASRLALHDGRVDESFALLERALELTRMAGDTWWEADIQQQIAERALKVHRPELAGAPARGALRLSIAIGDRQSVVYELSLLAHEAVALGANGRAGRLWGGIEAEVARGGPYAQWDKEQDEARAQIDAVAGPGFESGIEEGRRLSLETVIDEALRET